MLTISKLRNPYVMKWSLWVIIIITIPSFVLFYGFGSQAGGGINYGPMVTVHTDHGKVELDRTDLQRVERSAANYYTQLASPFVQPEQLQTLGPRLANALEPLEVAQYAVAEIALDQRLDREGIRITDTQVSQYLRDSGVTREQLAQILQANRISELEYAQNVRASLQDQMARDTVSRIARPSLLEMWNEYRLNEEKLDAQYASIPVSMQSDKTFTEEEIKARYDELAAEKARVLQDPAKRVYQFVSVATPQRTPLPVSEEDLRKAYDEAGEGDTELFDFGGTQVRHLIVPVLPPTTGKAAALADAQAALSRIEGGEDFATVANEVSRDLRNLQFVDENTSPTLLGGLLPVRLRNTVVARSAWGDEYVEFATGSEPGSISGPIETPQGYAIVKIEDRRPAGKMSFEQAEGILRARLNTAAQARIEEERKETIASNLSRFREAAAAQTTIAGVARELGAKVQITSPTLVTSTFIRGIGNLSNEREALSTLRLGRMSRPLQTNDGTVAVLTVAQEIEERILPFESARTQVESQMKREYEAEQSREKAEALIARVKAGDSLTSAALEMGYTAAKLDSFRRSEPPQELASSNLTNKFITISAGETAIGEIGQDPFISAIVVLHVEDVEAASKDTFMEEGIPELEARLLMTSQLGYVEEFRRSAKDELKAEFSDVFAPSKKSRRDREKE